MKVLPAFRIFHLAATNPLLQSAIHLNKKMCFKSIAPNFKASPPRSKALSAIEIHGLLVDYFCSPWNTSWIEIGRWRDWEDWEIGETERLGDWEMRDWEMERLGDWGRLKIGRLGVENDWEIGGFGDWEIERLENWEIGRLRRFGGVRRFGDFGLEIERLGDLGDSEIGRLGDLGFGRLGDGKIWEIGGRLGAIGIFSPFLYLSFSFSILFSPFSLPFLHSRFSLLFFIIKQDEALFFYP